jgi:hypothetical protein
LALGPRAATSADTPAAAVDDKSETHESALEQWLSERLPAAASKASSALGPKAASSADTPAAAVDDKTETDESAFEKWLRGTCRYKCGLCDEPFDSSAMFWDHVEGVHGLSSSDYTHVNSDDFCVVRNRIECQICLRSVDHDKRSVLNHFKKLHPLLKLWDYHEEYVQERSKRQSGLKSAVVDRSRITATDEQNHLQATSVPSIECAASEHTGTPGSVEMTSPVKKTSAPEDKVKTSANEDHQPVHLENTSCMDGDDVVDNSLVDKTKSLDFSDLDELFHGDDHFKCEVCCQEVAGDKNSVQWHMVQEHKLNVLQYYKLFVKDLTWYDGYLYQCSICGGGQTTASDVFRSHLGTVHNMGLSEYKASTGASTSAHSRSSFQCFKCKHTVYHDRVCVDYHMRRCTPRMTKTAYHNELKKHIQTPGYDCTTPVPAATKNSAQNKRKGCQPKNVVRAKKTKSTAPKNVVSDVKNACEYQCTLCAETTSSWKAMYKHIKKRHKDQYDPAVHSRLKMMSVRRYYSCRLCSAKIHCDLYIIARHAKNMHGLSMAQYRAGNSEMYDRKPLLRPMPNNEEIVDHCLAFRDLSRLFDKNTGDFLCFSCLERFSSSTRSSANTHCVTKHGINLLQYYKLFFETAQWDDACLYNCRICWDFQTTR